MSLSLKSRSKYPSNKTNATLLFKKLYIYKFEVLRNLLQVITIEKNQSMYKIVSQTYNCTIRRTTIAKPKPQRHRQQNKPNKPL